MIISSLTNKNLIDLNLDSKNSKEAILKLSDMMEQNGKLKSKESFVFDVITREKESTTAFGHGFALPHGKSPAVKEITLAVGRSREGIMWQSFDKKPVYFVILLAVPAEEAETRNLKAISEISRKLSHEEYRTKLLNAETEEEIIDILTV